MPRDVRVYLYDVQSAGREILEYISGMTLGEYQADSRTRRAVERCLSIMGEALVQARQHGFVEADLLPSIQGVINLRNFLVHEYSKVKDEVIWQVLAHHLPALLQDVSNLLESE